MHLLQMSSNDTLGILLEKKKVKKANQEKRRRHLRREI